MSVVSYLFVYLFIYFLYLKEKPNVLISLEPEQFELQSRWVARAIASWNDEKGACSDQGQVLPAVDHMVDAVERQIEEYEKNDSLRSAF